ncbi:TlpA family protein disulfide reductase [Sphingobacterium lumbrici]|uniref:TlpA family protein disulfide reductase n=1 Tax=Sphingobacterium lumbrici TaxID=2559600 RepID=UPI00112B4F7C|nr:TlpA disulfide reductase family protein [Sphingobacterium lumbrici]
MRLSLVVVALFITNLSFAQLSEIRGVMLTDAKKDISLYAIEEGRAEKLATTRLGENGSFGFLFEPQTEGFFVVGYDKIPDGQYPVYLKRGDKAEIAIDKRQFKFIGKQTPENTVLAKWNELTQTLKVKSVYFMEPPLSTYVDFFPEFTAAALKTDAFRKTIHTKNEAFNSLMRAMTYFDMDYYAMNFISSPRKAHPQPEDRPPYYGQIVQENKYPDDLVLQMPYGERLLDLYANFVRRNESRIEKLKYFSTDRQKAVYLMSKEGPFIQNYPAYVNFEKQFGQYFQTPVLKERLQAMGDRLYNTTSGGTAFVFSFNDKDEKTVSLADFKGKIVLLDVWATWCAPCKAEIPHLKALEKKYEGKEIVFLSVSVDEAKGKQDWLNMLQSQQLGGVQLYAGSFKNPLTDFYKITTIPRFMIFDPQGKIVSTNAPRPSDPKLKQVLDEQLAKHFK